MKSFGRNRAAMRRGEKQLARLAVRRSKIAHRTKGGGHPFEGLLVTDTTIYMTCSDPTNMTPELDSPRKTIYAFDADGKNKRVFCHGVRNVEKLRFRPGTTEMSS